ncbi:MAG: competence/damage-inducible protein A [Saprospirales bacterium]|nr:competence/damage-inducible protein A [Saprospirales bacterium]
MKARLLTIVAELLIGQVVDTNSAWMARQLNLIGARVAGKETVGDDPGEIVEGLQRALAAADVVLVTGGLGPTRDDITKKAIADFYKVGFVFSQETFEHIGRFLERMGKVLNDAHRDQCFMPQNALLLRNKMGTAPGMWFDENGKVVVSMPGVPYEMEYLMENEVLPRLQERFPASPILHHTLLTAGEGESVIAERIAEVEDQLPEELKLAYLPSLGEVRLRLTATGSDEPRLRQLLEGEVRKIRDLLPELIYGEGQTKLEEVVGKLLREKNWKLGTAESCTGGYLAHRMTSVPGASDYFKGSVIAYSNEIKNSLLGVRKETLDEFGAVSEETVREMAAGALQVLGVDLAVAVSGIAGPDGGTPEKPVGTIWVAVASKEKTRTQRLRLSKDRQKNIHLTAVHSLNLIRKFLLGEWS